MEYEVVGYRPRGRPKRAWLEIVQRDCQVCGLSRDDAMVRGRWRKLMRRLMSRRGVSGWMFLLVPAHPGRPGQRAVKRSCVCVCSETGERSLNLYRTRSSSSLVIIVSYWTAYSAEATSPHWQTVFTRDGVFTTVTAAATLMTCFCRVERRL